MKIESTAKWVGLIALIATLIWLAPARGHAQSLAELNTSMAISNELNSGQVSAPVGVSAIERARNVSGNTAAPTTNPSPTTPGIPAMPPSSPNTPIPPAALDMLMSLGPTITVLTGTRVFDPVTGALLDDAVQKQVKKDDAGKYYDDGTHGDPVANDGELAKVDEVHNALGLSNQRFKEQIVKALLVADSYTPLQYFGIPIASAERTSASPRNRTWSIVPAPNGSPGFTFREVPTTSPMTIPNYREKQTEKDSNIKNNWAVRFLQEFRANKDDMTSQFYTLYIPQPPQPPAVAPPPAQLWTPFSDPQSLSRAEMTERQNQLRGPMGPMGQFGMMGGGMMGGGMDAR